VGPRSETRKFPVKSEVSAEEDLLFVPMPVESNSVEEDAV